MADHVELDSAGFDALRSSPEAQAIVTAKAVEVANKANGLAQQKGAKYHAVKAIRTAHGCVALVDTGNGYTNGKTGWRTMWDNAKYDTLRKALG